LDISANSPAGESELADRIDQLLPQTQCTRCGYDGCRPYALAIARGEAAINRCPPGGRAGIEALAALLAREPLPLDPECGTQRDSAVAWIDPQVCTGCARCLPVCPVDAIIGAPRLLHTVYASHCTGCELCIASCPVDCIVMRPRAQDTCAPSADANRARYLSHQARIERRAAEQAQLLAERKRAAHASLADPAAPASFDP
jgi:electron transport complex protein RnfB